MDSVGLTDELFTSVLLSAVLSNSDFISVSSELLASLAEKVPVEMLLGLSLASDGLLDKVLLLPIK
ncbi:hypothetical protein [Carnobacterium inhibens]|uniref:Uncharacterized protein n=1 Tax=Carnobacterium inhibens TaxID=147709 RepID=A0ABR7TAA9_9LACT|nr:hypothetical protein [Carnobacterium inhibens]MBC9824878.1 hypothetical protein [Carnobacterium inhibens]